MAASEKYRVNDKPRISANQLAEYVLASPTRRQAILRNAKFAPTFLVIRYSEARESVTNYLTDGARPVSRLHADEAALKGRAVEAQTDFKRNDLLMSAEAISCFASYMADANQGPPKQFSNLLFVRPVGAMPKLQQAGVEVSIQLDLISRNIAKEQCGGIVLQTSKAVASKSWRDEHAACVSTLCWMACEQFLKGYGQVERTLCYSVDLFAKSVKQTPASYKTRAKDIGAACAEIRALWENIPPPIDLDF